VVCDHLASELGTASRNSNYAARTMSALNPLRPKGAPREGAAAAPAAADASDAPVLHDCVVRAQLRRCAIATISAHHIVVRAVLHGPVDLKTRAPHRSAVAAVAEAFAALQVDATSRSEPAELEQFLDAHAVFAGLGLSDTAVAAAAELLRAQDVRLEVHTRANAVFANCGRSVASKCVRAVGRASTALHGVASALHMLEVITRPVTYLVVLLALLCGASWLPHDAAMAVTGVLLLVALARRSISLLTDRFSGVLDVLIVVALVVALLWVTTPHDADAWWLVAAKGWTRAPLAAGVDAIRKSVTALYHAVFGPQPFQVVQEWASGVLGDVRSWAGSELRAAGRDALGDVRSKISDVVGSVAENAPKAAPAAKAALKKVAGKLAEHGSEVKEAIISASGQLLSAFGDRFRT